MEPKAGEKSHVMPEMTTMAVEAIKEAEYNPRQIAGGEFEKLKKGLDRFSIVEPLVVNADGTLIGGHQRLKAARELGWTEVPVVKVNLTKREEKALNLALNRLKGDWDYAKLSSLLSEFEADDGFDMELTGFDFIEAADLTSVKTISDADLMNVNPDEIAERGTNTPSLLNPTGEKDEKTTIRQNTLQFDRYKVPMSDEEKDAMKALAEAYLEQNGSLYGFAKHLMEESHVSSELPD